MEKTLFAGITVLDPGEPISSDGFAFTGIDRITIDRLLALGARLHRHDAHVALGAPTEEPTVALGADGGFIGAGVTVGVAYTLVDAAGGETLPSPVGAVSTPDGVLSPDESPEVTVEATGGTMLAGTYYYYLTLTDGTGGETEAGPILTVDVPPGTSTNQIVFVGLSDIVTGYPGAEGWRLYKGKAFGSPHFLAAGDADLDTVTDDGLLCADCTQTPPTENTTASSNSIDLTIPEHPANMVPAVAAFRVYVGTEGDFTNPAFLAEYLVTDLGTVVNVSSLEMQNGAPPDVATAIAGANKIDPNTEILEFHWLPPVEAHADLPEGARGDVRMTLENGRMWVVLASEAFGPDQWTQVAGGGGGTGGHEIWDEGLLVGPQDIIDFVGTGVTVTEDEVGGKLIVTIPGGDGGGGGPTEPADLVVLTTQGLEFREDDATGPLVGRTFIRRKAEYGVDENFLGDGGWPEIEYIVSETGESTLTSGASGLTPTDTTKKTFLYAGYNNNPIDSWWQDDFRITMRFDIQAGHSSDWGLVEFGIKDVDGHIVGIHTDDGSTNLTIFEQTGGTRTTVNVGGGFGVEGANWLTVERVGVRFIFGHWTASPYIEASVPVSTIVYTPADPTRNFWIEGLSKGFRPWISVQPDDIAAITYLDSTSGRAGLTVDYGYIQSEGYEMWGWTRENDDDDDRLVRRLVTNERRPYSNIGAGNPKVNSAVVTGGSLDFRLDGDWVQLQGRITMAGSAAGTIVSPPRGFPRRLWPEETVRVFLPYQEPDSDGRSGECWSISHTTGEIQRLSPPSTSGLQVILSGVRYLLRRA